MGINFGNLDTTVPTPTEVAPAPAGISLNLEKNTVLDLAKASPGLTVFTITKLLQVSHLLETTVQVQVRAMMSKSS